MLLERTPYVNEETALGGGGEQASRLTAIERTRSINALLCRWPS
jgi:hypothetical protein